MSTRHTTAQRVKGDHGGAMDVPWRCPRSRRGAATICRPRSALAAASEPPQRHLYAHVSPRCSAWSTLQRFGRRRWPSRSVVADGGGSGAGDGAGNGAAPRRWRAPQWRPSPAKEPARCEHASSSSHRRISIGEFEAGDRTGAGTEKGEGQQQWRHLRRARQRTLARACQAQAVSTGIARGSGAAFERRERTFVLDEGLEEDVGRRKRAAGYASWHESPASGSAHVVAGHS